MINHIWIKLYIRHINIIFIILNKCERFGDRMLELSDIAINNASSIEQKIYTKSSLIAISHGLEDMMTEFNLKSELFVTFQKFQFFLVEIERYKILDFLCKKMYIFARNINKDMVKGFKNTVFIEIDDNDPLVVEWNIIINHPEHPAVFLSNEVFYTEPVKEDQFRKFKGFLREKIFP